MKLRTEVSIFRTEVSIFRYLDFGKTEIGFQEQFFTNSIKPKTFQKSFAEYQWPPFIMAHNNLKILTQVGAQA